MMMLVKTIRIQSLWKTKMSEAYQIVLKNSNQRKEKDIEKYDTTNKLSPVFKELECLTEICLKGEELKR